MHIKKFIILTIFCLFSFFSFSQVQVYPLNNDISTDIDHFLLQKRRSDINTSFRPYCKKDMDLIADSMFRYKSRDSVYISRRAHKWFWNKLWKESFMQIDSAKYKIKIDPYFDFGEVLLQIAIVMSSVSIISNSRPVFIFSIGAALIGSLVTLNGFLLLIRVPFLH